MENYLSYYYGIKVLDIKEYDNYYIVSTESGKYLLCEVHDISLTQKIIDYLNNTNFLYYLLTFTKEEKLVVNIDDKDYSLFKIRDVDSNIDILLFSNYKMKGNCNWGTIWSERVDYYLEQIKEIVDSLEIKYVMDYYLSVAEIAISYFNNLQEIYNNNILDYSISHYVVDFDMNKENYYNPANMCIDLSIRDVAEYIKFVFFEEIKTNKEILDLVDRIKLDDAMANYFLVRLIYPSYFFRVFDKYIQTNKIDKKVDVYIQKNRDYESLLSMIYSKLKNRFDIKAYIYFFKSQY